MFSILILAPTMALVLVALFIFLYFRKPRRPDQDHRTS